jgi:excisionase family DNA binding protein
MALIVEWHDAHTQAHDYLSTLETARLLGVSRDTVRYHEKHGRLRAMRVGTYRVFVRSEVERFKREYGHKFARTHKHTHKGRPCQGFRPEEGG